MRKITLLLVLNIVSHFIQAQTINLNFSDPITANKKTGHFSEVIGENSKYVYVTMLNHDRSFNETKVRLVKYDKKTMKESSSVVVHDAADSQYSSIKNAYYQTLVFENKICVFWLTPGKEGEKRDLYVKAWDIGLNPISELTLIYTGINDSKEDNRQFFASHNTKTNQLLVGQISLTKESFSVSYKQINILNFSTVSSGTDLKFLSLKNETIRNFYNLKFYAGDDANFHFLYSVTPSDRKTEKQGEPADEFYRVYSVINPLNGEVKSFPIIISDKHILDFDFVVDSSTIKLFGLFGNLTESKNKQTVDGIFYGVLDSKTLNFTSKFHSTYFTDENLRINQKLIFYKVKTVKSIDNSIVLLCSVKIPDDPNFEYQTMALKIAPNARIKWVSYFTNNFDSNFKVLDFKKKFIVVSGFGEEHTKQTPYTILNSENGATETKLFTYQDRRYKNKVRTNEWDQYNGELYYYSIVDMAQWTHNREIVFFGKMNVTE